MCKDDCINSRKNELREAICECREEKRHIQNIIIAVATTMLAALSIITGITFTDPVFRSSARLSTIVNSNNWVVYGVMKHLSISRVILIISCFTFIATYSYVIKLGIDSLLVFYYERNATERLRSLDKSDNYPDNDYRGDLLTYSEYAAPIITLNIKHVSSSHTLLHYCVYIMSMICASVFCVFLIGLQYICMEARGSFDVLILSATVFYISGAIIFLFRMNQYGQDVFQMAIDTAHNNQKSRLNKSGRVYAQAPYFRHLLVYFLFPRLSDWYKWLIIPAGAFIHNYFFHSDIHVVNIGLVWFYYEFLLYGIRYQINDIRGILEDNDIGKNRLLYNESNSTTNPSDANLKNKKLVRAKRNIRHSLEVIVTKLLLAILLFRYIVLYYDHSLGMPLLLCTIGFVVLTVCYESVRTTNWLLFISLLVGLGTPLRILVGMITQGSIIPSSNEYLMTIVVMLLSFWFIGSYACLLSWRREVLNTDIPHERKFEKKHYNVIRAMDKNKAIKLWDCMYILSIIILAISIKYSSDNWSSIFFCSIEAIVFASSFWGKKSGLIRYFLISTCLIIRIIINTIYLQTITDNNSNLLLFLFYGSAIIYVFIKYV